MKNLDEKAPVKLVEKYKNDLNCLKNYCKYKKINLSEC